MIKVGVTGNIGSGKSEFINFIFKLGFKYISSDAIISKLYSDSKTRKIILEKLNLREENYKQEIMGKLHDEEFNRLLKKVIYPLLYSEKKILAKKHKTYQPIFYEVPLLYEENLSDDFNITVLIKADTNKRRQRVLNRGVSESYFKLMNSKQINEKIKKNKSTFTINNNGSILNLHLNIFKLLNCL
tara:strand:+ start:682 stop:1239 length:558 start_codon:yes stop_codon:yes gene_type:complete